MLDTGCWMREVRGNPPSPANFTKVVTKAKKAMADKGISEIVGAANLKNKIGAGSPCTIRCRVYAHFELEKFWRKSDPPCRSHGEAGAIQREKTMKNI